jgi:hypothetical protein
MRSDNTMMKP